MPSQINNLWNLPSQIELFEKLFKESSFAIIVLDACRYDCFKMVYPQYLQGTLIKIRSEGSNTFEAL